MTDRHQGSHGLIRVLVVDDHPAMRAGVVALLRDEPGLVPVAAVAEGHDLWPALKRTAPDVVVMDQHLPGDNGVLLCQRIKASLLPPRVVMYSFAITPELAVGAALAGADAVLEKSSRASDLSLFVRAVARGEQLLPTPSPKALRRVQAPLDDTDRAIVAMVLHRTPRDEIAATLGVDSQTLHRRIARILGALARTPEAAAA